MSSARARLHEDEEGLPGPYDAAETEDLWFLPDADEEPTSLSGTRAARLVEGEAWRLAEAGLATDLADLSFDAGRLAERLRGAGAGAVQRLALEEAAAISWWTGDRIGADRLALWLSYRIGAAEEGGEGLIRTAWAARRLMAPPSTGVAAAVTDLLGEAGRGDPALAGDVAEALDEVANLSSVTRGCAAFHLWHSLDERPDHLRGLEAAALGTRLAAGQGGLAFLPLALTGFGALTASGSPEVRLSGWIIGAHRAIFASLMTLDRLVQWREKAEAATADLQGRTPARLIAALVAHPMLAAAQAEADTGASRAAVLRNLDLLESRGLIREVTGQGRFRVWAARL
jgi:hypothetical protein